jgi:2-polyprenyl-3-methyl-5-hydroxy-6-metoxy-1,4-benzoquinol methylase
VFGETVDYAILRRIAHRRNMATEEELNAFADRVSARSFEEAMPKFRKLIDRFEGHFPIDPGLRYLDMGCGSGELAVACARLGVRRITGVDIMPRNIERACAYARDMGVERNAQFICQDLHTWTPDHKYDVLLSLDAIEHI